jgi:hypothetical protein
LEKTVKHQVEDILSSVKQTTPNLHKQLNEKFDETQVHLQAVKTSVDTWTGRLECDIMHKRRIFIRPL